VRHKSKWEVAQVANFVIMVPGWEEKIKLEARPKIHDLVDKVEAAARRNLIRHVVSGELISTLRSTKELDGGKVWIGTNHWHYIEYGTKRHVIKPRFKRALYWEGAMHPVMKVRHPGTPEYAPMRRALSAVRW
jgi:hypothetical protein